MGSTGIATAGIGILIVGGFLLILGLLWCLMPFLIMGTNGRLDRIIKQNAQIIALLEKRAP